MVMGLYNSVRRSAMAAGCCALLIGLISDRSYSQGVVHNQTQASARINIRLIIPRTIQLQAQKAENALPNFSFENRASLNKTELCFRQRGVPQYQLLFSAGNGHQTTLKTIGASQQTDCYLPFNHYTTEQLSGISRPQNNQLTLTVAPL